MWNIVPDIKQKLVEVFGDDWSQFKPEDNSGETLKDFLNSNRNLSEKEFITYQLLTQVVPSIMKMKWNLNYGFAKNKGKNKNNYIAIPYSKFNTPSLNSEFSDIRLSLILTILSYMKSSVDDKNNEKKDNSRYFFM